MSKPNNLLESKRYLLFWISSLLSNMGTWMQQVAQPWVVLSLSHSAMWVGIDSFAMNAPVWIFTLWGGNLADENDRRKIILVLQGSQFFCIALLLSLLVLGWLQVWMIVVISFFVGLTDSLSMPAFQSIIPSLVDSKDIPRAVAYNSVQFNLSRLLGPAAAGFIIARYGASVCFGANAVSYLPFFLSLYWICPKTSIRESAQASALTPFSKLGEFKSLLLNQKIRIPLLSVLASNLFCGSLVTFSPVLIKEVFHSGVEGFGGAMAAFGLGGCIGAGFSLVPAFKLIRRDLMSLWSSLFLGFILIFIVINHQMFLMLALLVIAGGALTVSNVNANAYLQQIATEHTRGRMASLFQLSIHGGLSIGALFTGLLAKNFGIAYALFVNSVAAIGIQTYLLYRINQRVLSQSDSHP